MSGTPRSTKPRNARVRAPAAPSAASVPPEPAGRPRSSTTDRGNRRVADETPSQRTTASPSGPSLSARLRDRLPTFDRARVTRILSGLGRFAAVVLVLAAAAAGGRLTERAVRTSAAFAIRTIDVRGHERLTEAEVLRAAGVQVGLNVFDTPPEDVRARLLRNPWVASATVRRRLPGTLEIELLERRAIAVLALDQLYLVGEDATVFKTREAGDPADLPVITLEDANRWLTDRPALSALLLDLVALVQDYRRHGLETRLALSELHIGTDDGVSLFSGPRGTRLALGRSPFDDKLRRLRLLLDELGRRHAEAEYVLLDHARRPERVVVRLRETVVPLPPMDDSAAPPPPPGRPT